MTVVPAYGRDYKTSGQALRDWQAGKDFKICDISSQWDGSYVSANDLGPEVRVNIRFDHLTRIVMANGQKQQQAVPA